MLNPDQQIIAFYNLENLFDTVNDPQKDDNDYLPGSFKNWDKYRYTSKLEHISESLESIKPGSLPIILGVSEVENKTVLKDLLSQTAFRGEYDFIHYDSNDRRGIDVGFLYNRKYFKPTSHEKIPVVFNRDTTYSERDILYVSGKFDQDDLVHFFINHWHSRAEGTLKSMPLRIAAAESLYNKAQCILQSDPLAKIVIMGDFNDLPVSKSITSYLHAVYHKNILSNQFFNLAFIPYRKKFGSLFAKGRWLMFDQIMISKGMMESRGIQINSSRLSIHFNKKLLFYDRNRSIYRPNRTYAGNTYHGGFSDHLPVYVKIDVE
ncbi:MAG: hypothetical protein ISR55_07090 [Bacteroidetes bacterium]|nr:hypothetical protein [Bacteroidota bacterium]